MNMIEKVEKLCSHCKEYKPLSNYYKRASSKDGLQYSCNVCSKEASRLYYSRHTERKKTKEKEWYSTPQRTKRRLELKQDVLTHYGNGKLQCLHCGYDNIKALSIDHINGNGMEEKRNRRIYGAEIYRWLKSNGYPNGYQTLCMNCQYIKRFDRKEYGGKRRTDK